MDDLTERSLVDRCVPPGWKLVPINATYEMGKAAEQYAIDTANRAKGFWWWKRLLEAGIAAAPEPPQEAAAPPTKSA